MQKTEYDSAEVYMNQKTEDDSAEVDIKVVKEKKITLPIFKDDLAQTVYVLKVTSENLNFSTKIVKE